MVGAQGQNEVVKLEFKMQPQRMLDMLVLLTGGLISLECMVILTSPFSLRIDGLGTLAPSTVGLLAIQMIVLCLVALLATAFLIMPGSKRTDRATKIAHLVALFSGVLLSIEGLATINVSTTISSAASSGVIRTAGLQLFCLGALVISSFIVAEGRPSLPKGISEYAVLMVLLLMLPAAFLV